MFVDKKSLFGIKNCDCTSSHWNNRLVHIQ